MNKLLLIGLVTALSVAQASAQTTTTPKAGKNKQTIEGEAGETGAKLEDFVPRDRKSTGGEQDADEVITNRKLRAETGSKNKYSFSSALSYNGGTVEKPLAKKRPNIKAAKVTPTNAALGGSIGFKYKLSSLQSLSADFGVGVSSPFHPDKRSFNDRSYIENPSIGYQILYKTGGVQNVSQFAVTKYTREVPERDTGYDYGFDLTQTMVSDFGGSKFSAGVLMTAGYNTFFKNDTALLADQGNYSLGAYPFMEYVINDRLNLRTISGLWVYDHDRATKDFWTFNKNKIYQSVGLGISVTRDIYLYPNVQFLPENIRADATNVALTANVNL
jgi:hypothetical protein